MKEAYRQLNNYIENLKKNRLHVRFKIDEAIKLGFDFEAMYLDRLSESQSDTIDELEKILKKLEPPNNP